MNTGVTFRNGDAIALADLAPLDAQTMTTSVSQALRRGERLAALFATAVSPPEIYAVLADDAQGALRAMRASVPERRYPSLTQDHPTAQAFEREILEQTGIVPEGHPWPKPLRRHADLEGIAGNAHPFFRVNGPGIHEVAVGPVHAGIIEPGHFRFQCHGEEVLSLEIQLGYQHRAAEGLMETGSPARRLVVAESIAGDTVVGHALTYAMTCEALAGVTAPLRADALRAVALELERLANHVGDLGGLSTDVAHLAGASYFGRLRGELLNSLMELCGSRYGRGLVRPGGVRFDLAPEQAADLRERLRRVYGELRQIIDLVLRSSSVESRFERTGIVSRQIAEDLGLVGPVGRASGCARDVRRDHAYGLYQYSHIPVATLETGDVMARASVRAEEAERSLEFLDRELEGLPGGELGCEPGAFRGGRLAVAMVEGWRGEILHAALTDEAGRLRRYKIVDPSFHNWFGLAIALRGNQISDFPLCNKSFNLSYAGHDL